MGQYLQYGANGGMVWKNAPGVIWAHGKCELGHAAILISDVYTCFLGRPFSDFRLQTLFTVRIHTKERLFVFHVFFFDLWAPWEAALAADLTTA